jgi:hypothetical protein
VYHNLAATGENGHVEVLVDCVIDFQSTEGFSDVFGRIHKGVESAFYKQNSISMKGLWLMVYNHGHRR